MWLRLPEGSYAGVNFIGCAGCAATSRAPNRQALGPAP